jgi:hypothetical protein
VCAFCTVTHTYMPHGAQTATRSLPKAPTLKVQCFLEFVLSSRGDGVSFGGPCFACVRPVL